MVSSSQRVLLKPGLDGLMVVGVGAGCTLAQDLALGDFTDEQCMAAQILFLFYLAGEHSIGVLRQVIKAVVAALNSREGFKLVDLSAGLHTEVLDGIEGHILGQNTDVELAGLFDNLPGQIFTLAGDGDPCGRICHLHAGIDDAAVVLIFLCGQHEQAIA